MLLEHSNRGKKSLGPGPRQAEEGLDILYRLAATADVFLTNKLRRVRTKLKIDVDDIRTHNPNIIYMRGTGQGERGPDADKGVVRLSGVLVPPGHRHRADAARDATSVLSPPGARIR